MNASSSRIRRAIRALAPIQAPDLQPWEPAFTQQRPNGFLRTFSLLIVAGLVALGLGATADLEPVGVTDNTATASVVDDVVDLIEDLLDVMGDEDEEAPPAG